MSVFAYLRVSTTNHDQTTDNQRKAILDYPFKVDQFFSEDGVSGSIDALDRPVFSEMILACATGDTVICTMVDRLGRNAKDILNTVEAFKEMGVKLRVMQFDGIDVTSSTGKLIITVMAALAEMEKNMLVERTKAGIYRAKEAGIVFGRRLKIAPETLAKLCDARNAGVTLKQLSEEYNLDAMTIQRNTLKWNSKVVEYEELYNKQHKQISA